jgi:hypothetical protein
MDLDKPSVTNADEANAAVEQIFADEAGTTDVEGEGNGGADTLDLTTFSKLAGREFTSNEDLIKHYKGLNSLVGDQKIAELRKLEEAGKSGTQNAPAGDDDLKARLETMEKTLVKKDFLLDTPTAREYLDLVEAVSEKKGISLIEAWKEIETKVQTSQGQSNGQTPLIGKNRVTPPDDNARMNELAALTSKGDQAAASELVMATVFGKR